MSDLKPCPFCGNQARLVRRDGITLVWCKKCETGTGLCVGDGAITKWNTRPAEDAKDKEIERLKNDLEIQKNLTRMACFESNRAYDEVEKWKKMFYDLIDKQSKVATDPKVIIVGTDTNVPTNAPDTNVGTMEG